MGCIPRTPPAGWENLAQWLSAELGAALAAPQIRIDYRRYMVEPFVQGVLSGTIWEPKTVDAQDAACATAIGMRFVAAARRLTLWDLL